MWFGKSRYITNNVLELFLDEHGHTPGILDVQDDGVKRDSIIIFFDDKKLPKHSLPQHFYGHPLQLYNVRQVLKDTKYIIGRIERSKEIDLSVEDNRKVYEKFFQTVKLCEALLKKQRETSEVSATT